MEEDIKQLWYEKLKDIPSVMKDGVEWFSLVDLGNELGLNHRFFPMHGLNDKVQIGKSRKGRLAAPMQKIQEVLQKFSKNWNGMKLSKRKIILDFLDFIREEMHDWLGDQKQATVTLEDSGKFIKIDESVSLREIDSLREVEDEILQESSAIPGGPAVSRTLPGLKTVQYVNIDGVDFYILKSVDEVVEIRPVWFDNAENINVQGRGNFLCVTYEDLVKGLHRFYLDAKFNSISRTSQERIEKFLLSLGDTNRTASPARQKKTVPQAASLEGFAEMLQSLASGKRLVITLQVK